jgi:hypothetical protein
MNRSSSQPRATGTTLSRKVSKWQTENEVCAEIILSDVKKYGEGSLPVIWANAILAKAAAERGEWRLTA